MIDISKIKQAFELIEMLDENKSPTKSDGQIKIVILQRGWVVVGRFFKNGHNCWIENGYVIRQWGTTKGLGELAMNGKQDATKLDPIPKTEFHELTIVASIICDESKWKELC